MTYGSNGRFNPDRHDISERYSRALDRIPGFRERNHEPRPLAWIKENAARRWTFMILGAGLSAGALTLALTLSKKSAMTEDDREENGFQANTAA